ncbi:MAG TPA: hypothetical protein PLL71_11250 [Agriterribacter sp.]|nr:hypothetical protein [Agriterribacter sp.]HRQ50186.1 hypothetical protein [Agriterribacter sp.]
MFFTGILFLQDILKRLLLIHRAYPYRVLKALKAAYPYAVINIINTSIGGENSESGAKRFATDVPEKHALQSRSPAKKYGIGLANSYAAFKQVVDSGNDLNDYMSQINHPNEKGHTLIAKAILKYFIN